MVKGALVVVTPPHVGPNLNRPGFKNTPLKLCPGHVSWASCGTSRIAGLRGVDQPACKKLLLNAKLRGWSSPSRSSFSDWWHKCTYSKDQLRDLELSKKPYWFLRVMVSFCNMFAKNYMMRIIQLLTREIGLRSATLDGPSFLGT